MFIVPFIMKVNVHQQQNGNKILFTTKILLLQCVMDRPQTLGTDDLGLEFQFCYLPCKTKYVDMSI